MTTPREFLMQIEAEADARRLAGEPAVEPLPPVIKAKEDPARIDARYLTGRCANGANASRGRLYHAVQGGNQGVALCGARYGARSAGFSYEGEALEKVTCARCLKRLQSLGVQS
jgi:hypothetical protein